MEAYRNENPIPVLKQAYNQYQRNKRKAQLRRAMTGLDLEPGQRMSDLARPSRGSMGSINSLSPDRKSKVDLHMKQGDESVYDSPGKKVVFAHELKAYDSLIMEEMEVEAADRQRESELVFEAYEGRVLDMDDKKGFQLSPTKAQKEESNMLQEGIDGVADVAEGVADAIGDAGRAGLEAA